MANLESPMDIYKIDPTKSAFLDGFRTAGWRHPIMHLMTAIGAWGGFPDPPAWWDDLIAVHPLMKWFMLAILCFQGGDEQDFQMALEFTVLLYIGYHGGNHLYKMVKGKGKKKK